LCKIFGVFTDGLEHAGLFGEAVVDNFAGFIFIDDNVVKLDISMNDFFGVQILKSLNDLQYHFVILNCFIFSLMFLAELAFSGKGTARVGFGTLMIGSIFL
jgi:hypothetical protein